MALTGAHAVGDHGSVSDDNLRDLAIAAQAAALAGKLDTTVASSTYGLRSEVAKHPTTLAGSPYASARLHVGRQRKVDTDALYNAFPGIAKTATGRLLVTFTSATGHDVAGQLIETAYSDDAGATFTVPAAVFTPTGNQRYKSFMPLGVGADVHGIGWYSDTTTTPATGKLFRSVSVDNGVTFSTPTDIAAQPYSRLGAVEMQPLVLANGNWLLAAYGSDTSSANYSTAIGLSADSGVTWTWVNIVDGIATAQAWTEPTAAILPDGTLQCLIRNTTDSNIYRSTSADSGVTWSAPVVAFVGGGRPSQVVTSLGTVVALFRQSNVLGDGMMRFSRDNGVTWSTATTFTNGRGVFTYAHGVEVSPGVVAIATSQESNPNNVADILFGYISEPGIITPLADADFHRRSSVAPIVRASRVIAYDTMERSDENPVDRMDSSHAWINWGYGHKLVSGRLKGITASTPTGALTAFDLQRSDACEITTSILSTASFTGGVVFQMFDNLNYYLLNLSGAAGAVTPTLYKAVAGTLTSISAGAAQVLGYNVEYPVKITHRAGRIKCYVDNEKVIDIADATYSANTHVGFRCGADTMEFGPIAVLT